MTYLDKLKSFIRRTHALGGIKRKRANLTLRRLSFEHCEPRAMLASLTTSQPEAPTTAHSQIEFVAPALAGGEGENSGSSSSTSSLSGLSSTPRHNTANRFDVNQDGIVTPNDALKILNVLNQFGVSVRINTLNPQYKGFFDVTDDSLVTPIDLLHVINFIAYTSRDLSFATIGPKTLAIGNSLTDDLLFNFPTKGLAKISQTTSEPLVVGSHLNCAKTLTRIWANPDETCKVTGGDKYRVELAKPIDNVIFQPFYGATIAQEINAIKNLINYTKQNPDNANTRFFIYATWGVETDTKGVAFYDHWKNHKATLRENWTPSKSTFDLMLQELHQTGYEISLIPAGHTFSAIIDALRSGKSIMMTDKANGTFTSHELVEKELWRDGLHGSQAIKLSTGLTALSVIYGRKPTGVSSLDYTLHELQTVDSYVSESGTKQLALIAWNTHLYLNYPGK
jgi:Dockerin type I domain